MSRSFKSFTHPIPKDTAVTILRLGPFTPPYVEGIAIIREPGEEPDQYFVTFLNDPVIRLRFVFQICQSEPLAPTLQCLWRGEVLTSVIDVSANDNAPKSREAAPT